MTQPHPRGPVETVRDINENRGCPYTIDKTSCMGAQPVESMSHDERKQEYYYLLDSVVPEVVDIARGYREKYPGGIATQDEEGTVVSGLEAMKAKVDPHIRAGNFVAASYWVHDAIAKTFNIAADAWFARTNRQSPEITRINQLVGDPYKEAYGDQAIQEAVASAANQTVFISAGFQKMTYEQLAKTGTDIRPEEMRKMHDSNLKFAMPLTNLHFTETGNIIALLQPQAEPNGVAQVYANDKYFIHDGETLASRGTALVDDLAQHFPGTFPDQRIGCPGAKFVPEIWSWIGDLTEAYACPALVQQGLDFTVPRSLPRDF